MKIVLELPEWVDERHIRIFAGVELVALKLGHEDFWKVKDTRCQRCGECCKGIKNHKFPNINGACIHLVDEPGQPGKKKCNIVLHRPRTCEVDPKSCKHITYKKVKCK